MFRIGIDLGGTKTEAVLLGPQRGPGQEGLDVLHRRRIPTPQGEGDDGYNAIIRSTASLVTATLRLVPAGEDATVGIGIPGSIDGRTGLVRNANSTTLIGHPLKRDLESLLSRNVGVENDANCFTLAEATLGAGRGHGLVFGVIMGTGCGGGIAINGEVRRGPHGIAGEWGHVSVDPQGNDCYCGKRGCIETKISGSGVEATFRMKHGRRLSMSAIVAGARDNDPSCARAFSTFLDDFGRAMGGLISILDPDAVVLGGGLSNIDELYTIGVERVRRYAFHDDLRTPILKNALGDSAGVFGAAWIGQ